MGQGPAYFSTVRARPQVCALRPPPELIPTHCSCSTKACAAWLGDPDVCCLPCHPCVRWSGSCLPAHRSSGRPARPRALAGAIPVLPARHGCTCSSLLSLGEGLLQHGPGLRASPVSQPGHDWHTRAQLPRQLHMRRMPSHVGRRAQSGLSNVRSACYEAHARMAAGCAAAAEAGRPPGRALLWWCLSG